MNNFTFFDSLNEYLKICELRFIAVIKFFIPCESMYTASHPSETV
jgi:hypothetical protein